ncbi:unnamed protein product [Lota lota]
MSAARPGRSPPPAVYYRGNGRHIQPRGISGPPWREFCSVLVGDHIKTPDLLATLTGLDRSGTEPSDTGATITPGYLDLISNNTLRHVEDELHRVYHSYHVGAEHCSLGSGPWRLQTDSGRSKPACPRTGGKALDAESERSDTLNQRRSRSPKCCGAMQMETILVYLGS